MKIEWTEDLTVGVNIIDQQHQEYFRKLNRLLEAVERGQVKEELLEIIGFVGNYVEFHFNTEEAFMTRKNYPQYASHAEQHMYFRNEFNAMRNEFEIVGASSSLVLRLKNLLVDWFINHIKTVDTALGEFLKTAG